MANRVYIIAEAGVNHNGSLVQALKLVDVASESGADAVKFQTFKAESLATPDAPMAGYQIATRDREETQYEMLRRLELNEADHHQLAEHCKSRGIEFLSTPFDLNSLAFLVNSIGVNKVKFSSGDITNAPLLLEAARTKRQVIISSGMSSLGEVEAALGVLAYGFTEPGLPPSLIAFERAYSSDAGQAALRQNVILLHCTSEYPAPLVDVNLCAMSTMARTFRLRTGYSDHTSGITIPVAAVALGATVIEKHFTLDRNLSGPDHKASLEPEELKEMVQRIREVELALGSGTKYASTSESRNKSVARKSLVAARNIRAGEIFTEENLAVKRPGDGLSPMGYWDLLGEEAGRDYRRNERIDS